MEVAIVNIQYSFNWTNFYEEFLAFILSVRESEAERDVQKEQQLTEGDITLPYLKPQSRLSNMQHPLDPNAVMLYDYIKAYGRKIAGEFYGTKLMKIPTG